MLILTVNTFSLSTGDISLFFMELIFFLTNVTIAAALVNPLEFALYHITVITVIVAAVYAVPLPQLHCWGRGGQLPPCSYFTVL